MTVTPDKTPEKVVVIGAGMVGHRFVEELVRADLFAPTDEGVLV